MSVLKRETPPKEFLPYLEKIRENVKQYDVTPGFETRKLVCSVIQDYRVSFGYSGGQCGKCPWNKDGCGFDRSPERKRKLLLLDLLEKRIKGGD